MQLWLIRHPPPAVAEGVCYGVTDLALAAPPGAQAAALAPRLPKAPVLASPLRRCHQFAVALAAASGTALHVDQRLREMDFGAWEMQPWKEIPRAALDAWVAAPMAYRGHGGEAVQDLMDRARAFINGLPEVPAVVAVTHAGIMKCVLGHLLGLPREEWFGLHFDYGSVTRLDRENGVWRLISQNTGQNTADV